MAIISELELRVYEFARKARGWFEAKDVARITRVKGRTVRLYLLRLTQLGVLERRRAVGYRYRLVESHPGDRADEHVRAIEAMRETFDKGRGRGGMAKKFIALIKGPEMARGRSPDMAAASLAFELAKIGRASAAERQNFVGRVAADIDSAWEHLAHARQATG